MPFPKLDGTINFGHIAILVGFFVTAISGWALMQERLHRTNELLLTAQSELDAAEDRIRIVETRLAQTDERFLWVQQSLSRIESALERTVR